MKIKTLLTLLLLLITYSSAKYLYSVSTPEYKYGKLVTIIDLSNGKTISNVFIGLKYQIVDILSIDEASNTLLLFCSYILANYLVSVDISSSNFTILSVVPNGYSYSYEFQSFAWIEQQKIAFIPVLVGEFSLKTPISSMQINFDSKSVSVTNYSLEGASNMILPLQWFDSLNEKVYLSYSTYDSNSGLFGTNMFSYNFSNLIGSAQTFQNIENVTSVTLIFTDSKSNVYLIKQDTIYNGFVDICKLDLLSKTCPTFYTHEIGSYSQYQFNPFIVSQDGSTLLIISKDQSGSSFSDSSSSSGSYDLTFFKINSNFQKSTLKIEDYWPNDQFFSNSFIF
ncbi:hypothetical protein RB653_003367 [Dictyostelium firmibasis]|uniref:Transmembrane protein n=1 Tax=Dictyostelium firmibasis TaxID=79012 RepID=A0AAN7TXP5_9MYCE